MSDLMAPDDQRTRRELLLGMIQKEFPNYHPLMSIARIAHDENADLKLQFECHKTVAKYVEPELKSIEVKGEIQGRHKVSVSLFEPSGASFGPVEAQPGSVIEGTAVSPKALPGGANIDMDPATVDRVTVSSW